MDLFSLQPLSASGGFCPRDDVALHRLRLHLPGWRWLIEGVCSICGHRYIQDLPSGHGLIYPTTLDLDTGEVLDPANATWFASRLKPSYEAPDTRRVSVTVVRRREPVRPLVANCLDPVYGHALLKLLGVASATDSAQARGRVAVVSRALAPLAPTGIDELWVVETALTHLYSWLWDVHLHLKKQLGRFSDAGLARVPPHPHPETYDLDTLAPDARPESLGFPSIVFSLRDDRPWGAQRENVAALMSALVSEFPDVRAAAVGPGDPGGLPGEVLDLRDPSPSQAEELRWVRVMRGADLAIGVHGSNLLLPSGFAAATVELVPEGRYGNLFQATLVAQRDPLLTLDRHRVLYGSHDLADISPERVAGVAIALLRGFERFHRLMTGPAAGQGGGSMPRLAPVGPQPEASELPPSASERAKDAVASLAGRVLRRAELTEAAENQRERDLVAELGDRVVAVLELNDDVNGVGDARRRVGTFWERGLRVHRLDDALTPLRVAGRLEEPIRAVVLRPDSHH